MLHAPRHDHELAPGEHRTLSVGELILRRPAEHHQDLVSFMPMPTHTSSFEAIGCGGETNRGKPEVLAGQATLLQLDDG